MHEIKISQINVSDDLYKLTHIYIKSGDEVSIDSPICDYESSKSTFEVLAEKNGFFYLNPIMKEGKDYPVGTIIGIITKKRESEDNLFQKTKAIEIEKSKIKITKKAKELIDKKGISIKNFLNTKILTLEMVEEFLNSKNSKNSEVSNSVLDIKSFEKASVSPSIIRDFKPRLGVVGAGKAALQVFDAVNSSNSHRIITFYEENEGYALDSLLGIEITKGPQIERILEDKKTNKIDQVIISFTSAIKRRSELFNKLLNEKIEFGNVFHKSTIIGHSVEIGYGNTFFANVRIGPFTKIGNNNSLSSGTSIEHNNILGDGNTFGPGVMTSGSCTIGNMNLFGMNIGLEPKIIVGDENLISSGVILTNHIENEVVVRNSSKLEIKEKKPYSK